MGRARVQWGRGPDFAEVAEVLGIRTNQVAARIDGKRGYGVLWSTDDEPDDAQYVELARDASGVLVRVAHSERVVPHYFSDLFKRLEDSDA